MKTKLRIALSLLTLTQAAVFADSKNPHIKPIEPAKVDYSGFQTTAKEVKDYRKSRLIALDKFNEMSKEQNTIILDTRSAASFKGVHMKGAVHINFSDFTKDKLAKVIPNKNTRILIYCNNNFKDNPRFLVA